MKEKTPAAGTTEATNPTTSLDPTGLRVKLQVPSSDSEWVAALFESGFAKVLSVQHFRILMALRYHGAPGTVVFPGLDRLAELTGMSTRHVRRTLRALESVGLIQCLSLGGGRSKHGGYTLSVPSSGASPELLETRAIKTRTSSVRVSQTRTLETRVSGVRVSAEPAQEADLGDISATVGETRIFGVRVSETRTSQGPKPGHNQSPPQKPEPAQDAGSGRFPGSELSIELRERKNTLPKGSGALYAHEPPPTQPAAGGGDIPQEVVSYVRAVDEGVTVVSSDREDSSMRERPSDDTTVSCGGMTVSSHRGASTVGETPRNREASCIDLVSPSTGDSQPEPEPDTASVGGQKQDRRGRKVQKPGAPSGGARRNPTAEVARELAARWGIDLSIAIKAVTAAVHGAKVGLEQVRELVVAMEPSGPPANPIARLVALVRETQEHQVEEEQMMVALEIAGVPPSLRRELVAFCRTRGLGLGAVRKCAWELRGLLDSGATEKAVMEGLSDVPSGLREWNAWWDAVKRIHTQMEIERSRNRSPYL